MHDLTSSAQRLGAVVAGIDDAQLSSPTPCEGYRVSGMVHHVILLTVAFRFAAEKDPAASATPPSATPDAEADLPDGWRELIQRQLDELVAAWQQPAAWEGETEVGGVALPAAVAPIVALQEIVIHGWDLAKASGQPYDPDPAHAELLLGALDGQVDPDGTPGLFGPPVLLAGDAATFDRVIGLTGRDPSWTPA